MAQKTPLPAKTVTYADRWNATWFADLMMFRRKLIEDYHLRFIVTHFLWKKRYLLYLFSLNQNSSCTYLQLAVLPTYERAVVTPMLFPTRPRQKALKEWQTQFNKIKLGALYMLQPVIVDTWEKRLTYEEEQTWLHIMTYFNHTTQAPASWVYLQAFPAVNRRPLLLPKNLLKLKQASALNVDVVLLEKASLELYFFFLDQMKTTQSLVYDGLSYTQHWIQHLPRMLDKAWFNDKNGFSLIKKAIQRLPFVGVWPRSLLNLLVVPKTQSLFKAFPLFTERLNNYLPTYTPYESGLPFRYGPVHLPYRKSGVATQWAKQGLAPKATVVKKRERRAFSTLPTVDSFLDLRKGIDFIVKDYLEDDTNRIRSKLVGVYYTVYKKIRQKSLEAGVEDTDAFRFYCKARSQERVRHVLAALPAVFTPGADQG